MSPQPEPLRLDADRFRLVRGLTPYGVEIGLTSLLVNACGLVMPIFSMLVYDKVVGNGNNETLWALVGGMLLILFFEFSLRLMRSYAIERLGAVVELRADARALDRLLVADASQVATSGVLMSRYRDQASARDALLAQYSTVTADLPFLLLYLTAVACMGGSLVLVPLCAALPLLAGQWAASRPQRAGAAQAQAAAARKTSLLAQLVGGLPYLQSSPRQNAVAEGWDAEVEAAVTHRSRQRFWQTAAQAWGGLCIGMSSVALLAAGVYKIEAGSLSVGALIACSLVNLRAMVQVSSIVPLILGWQELQRTQSELDEASLPDAASAARAEGVEQRIRAGEVSVLDVAVHDAGGTAILDGIKLSVAAGERIAIVGRPGSGKSTLLRALAGVQPTHSGHVLYDGARIDSLSLGERAAHIVYKPQDPVLLGPTIQDELEDLDPKLLPRVLDLTGLAAALRNGELTRDRRIAGAGHGLSGGQRQMLALARALASDASILLLDEPTLGVDAETEQRLAAAIDELTRGKTVILATHSTTLLQKVDTIVVLERGKVAGVGPREKMLV